MPEESQVTGEPDGPQTPPVEDVVASALPIAREEATEILPERPDSSPEPRVPPRPLSVACAVLAVLTLLLGWMVFAPSSAPLKLGGTRDAARAREERSIVRVAERFAKNVLSVDHRTMSADIRRATSDASDRLKARVRGMMELTRGSSTFTVTHAYLIGRNTDVALVDIIGRWTVRSASKKTSRSERQELHVVLVKTDDGWKVSDLGAPNRGSQ